MIYFSLFVLFCYFYFYEEITEYLKEFHKFIEFIHEHNPLLLSYYDDECLEFYYKKKQEREEKEREEQEQEEQEKNKKTNEEDVEKESNTIELYDNKYLKKFKDFTNEYSFNNEDLEYEKNKFKEIINNHYHISIPNLEKKISEMKLVINDLMNEANLINKKYPNGEIDEMRNCDYDSEYDKYTNEMWNDFGEIEEIERNIINSKLKLNLYENELNVLDKKTDFQLHEEARDKAKNGMVENKLKDFINNYIIEFTPLGNVIMRYNNDKQSFEYFSDHSVPYRYLEPIGRKYVMTYRCKAIFIDMDEEVEKVNKLNETKMKEMKEMKENVIKNKMNKNLINKPHSLINKKIEMPPNRNGQSIVNPINDIDIIVKNANRYTWEGRLLDFKIIKSEYKNLHKDRNISFKEYNRRQQYIIARQNEK